MSRVLIVNADDYGRTPGVSAGIRQAHQSGIVTAATVMTNLPGAEEAIHRALEEAPAMGLGVHLTLTFGPPRAPESEVPSLLDNGRLRSLQDVLANPGSIRLQEVEREWRAQVDALLRAGATLDHLDSHHHIALLLPEVWEICLSLGAEHGVGVRPPWPSDGDAASLTAMLPAGMREFASGPAARALHAAGLPCPDHFFAGFYGPSARFDHLLSLLSALPRGVSEIMTHPGLADPPLLAGSGYAQAREIELAALTHPDLPGLLPELGIRLATYRSAWSPT